MLNAEIAERRKTSIARGVGMQTQVYVDRALNAEVWDVEGNRYIDFAAGIAVVNTGHRHPRVIAAVERQLHSFTHTCHQVLPYENYIHLGERLNALVPGDFEKRTVFVTTGAEAVENAVKITRIASRLRNNSSTELARRTAVSNRCSSRATCGSSALSATLRAVFFSARRIAPIGSVLLEGPG